MSDARLHDAVPTSVRELLELFRVELNGVRFPDIDEAVLDGLASDVRAQAEEVERVRVALSEARKRLEERQVLLLEAARKGYRYATIYADGDDELGDRLDELELAAEGKKKKKPRRRKRPASKKKAAEGQAAVTPLPQLPLSQAPTAPAATRGAA